MPQHLFFMLNKNLNRSLYGSLFIIKELFCNLLIRQIMENRKIIQKRFCMFEFEISQYHKAN